MRVRLNGGRRDGVRRRAIWQVTLVLLVLLGSVPGRGAVIALNAREHRNLVVLEGINFWSPRYKGKVTFSNQSNSLYKVRFYEWVGAQWVEFGNTCGPFGRPSAKEWEYSACATDCSHSQGSGPYTTKDEAWAILDGQINAVMAASGQAPWCP